MQEDDVKMKLKYGIRHVYFAMEICELQAKEGRYFVFEHPKTASSWGLPKVNHVLSMPGVRKIDIDMCMFGMTTADQN
eukprot:10833981-Karenia_brevis.AAC.1